MSDRKPYEAPAVIHSCDADEVIPIARLVQPVCDTVDCNEQASSLAHWPGTTRNFCEPCATRAVRIAAPMGFKLSLTPLRT